MMQEEQYEINRAKAAQRGGPTSVYGNPVRPSFVPQFEMGAKPNFTFEPTAPEANSYMPTGNAAAGTAAVPPMNFDLSTSYTPNSPGAIPTPGYSGQGATSTYMDRQTVGQAGDRFNAAGDKLTGKAQAAGVDFETLQAQKGYQRPNWDVSGNDEEMFQQGKQRDTGSSRLNPNVAGIRNVSGFNPQKVIQEKTGQGGVPFRPTGTVAQGTEGYDSEIDRLMQMYYDMAGVPESQAMIAQMITDIQMQKSHFVAQKESQNPFNLSQSQWLDMENARIEAESGSAVAEQTRMSREAEFAAQTAQQQTMYQEQTAQRGIETGAETTQRQAEFDRDAMIRQIEQTERSRGDMEQTVRQRQGFDAQTAQQQQGFESQQVQQQQGFEAQTEQQGQSLEAQTQQQQQQFDNQQILAKQQLDDDYARFSAENGLQIADRNQRYDQWELEFNAAGTQRSEDIAQEMSKLTAEFDNQQALFGTSSAAETQQRQDSLNNQLELLREQYAVQKADAALEYEKFELRSGSESAIQLARIQADKTARVAEAAALATSRTAEAASEATSRSAEASAAGNPFNLSADQWIAEQALNRTAAQGATTRAQAPDMIQAILGVLNPEVLGSLGYLSGEQELGAVPTISSLRQAPTSQLNFLQGLFGAAGIEPSMLMNLIKSVSPEGGGAVGSTF